MTIWLWLLFALFVAVLVIVDLGLTTRKPRVVTPVEAFASFALWLVAAAAFSVGVFYVYEKNFLNLEAEFSYAIDNKAHDLSGHAAWLQYITSYVLELALSLDNIAVLALLMAYYKVPRPILGRALFWSLLLTLVIRLLAVFSCAWFMRELPWFRWVLGGILVVAMLRMLVLPDSTTDFGSRWYARALRRFIPFTDQFDGQRLFTRRDGRLVATPIVLIVLIGGLLDVVFAADSIPALFSVTTDPTLAFTASAMAILGLRSLYIALNDVVGRFRYLRISVVFILLYVAGKMFVFKYDEAPTRVTLAVVSGVMLIGVGASALHNWIVRRRAEPGIAATTARPTPLKDLGEAVDVTRRNLRKVIILIAGTFVVLVGVVLVGPLPGPGGVFVVGLGLGILATEFIWARKILLQIQAKTRQLTQRTDSLAGKTSVWLAPVIVIGFVALVALAASHAPYRIHLLGYAFWLRRGMLIAFSIGPAVPIFYWAWRTIALWLASRRAQTNGRPSASLPAPDSTLPRTRDHADSAQQDNHRGVA